MSNGWNTHSAIAPNPSTADYELGDVSDRCVMCMTTIVDITVLTAIVNT